MKTIDFSYFIERYNAGEMSEAEKLWFRRKLTVMKSFEKKWISGKKQTQFSKIRIFSTSGISSTRYRKRRETAAVPVKRTIKSVQH